MPDYIPRTDNDFDRWFAKFLGYILGHSSEMGLTDHELAELKIMNKLWEEKLLEHHLAQASARKATEAKEKQRALSIKVIRKYVRVIQARPATSNEQRRALGITLKPDAAGDPGSFASIASRGECMDY